MRLIHYSAEPLGTLFISEQGSDTFKPRGLWISDDDCEDNWREWCESENFRLNSLAFPHEIKLMPDANVLILRSAFEIDAFTREYESDEPPMKSFRSGLFIDWRRVRERYDGLIVTPYIWSRRVDGNASWYYSWDCASGCIWNPRAIKSVICLPAREILAASSPGWPRMEERP